jgi:hypothetical protein
MGIDDILMDNDERRARELQEAAQAPAKAQALRNEMHALLTSDLLSAIRTINDEALGNCAVVPITDVAGSNRRTIQIDCRGQVHAIFKTVVHCAPGDRHASYESIKIIVNRGERRATGEFDGRGARRLEPDSGLIDPAALRERLHDIVRHL